MGLDAFLGIGQFVANSISAIGTLESAGAQAKAAEFNAKTSWQDATISDQNAAIVSQQAGDDERKLRVMGRRQIGSMITAQASSGLIGGEDMIQEARTTIENDALNIRAAGSRSSAAFRAEADRKRDYSRQLQSGAASTISGANLAVAGKMVGGLLGIAANS